MHNFEIAIHENDTDGWLVDDAAERFDEALQRRHAHMGCIGSETKREAEVVFLCVA